VEFSERILANRENYAAIAGFAAQNVRSITYCLFARSYCSLNRRPSAAGRDQSRISTNFAFLERLMLESAAFAGAAAVVNAEHVQRPYRQNQLEINISRHKSGIQLLITSC